MKLRALFVTRLVSSPLAAPALNTLTLVHKHLKLVMSWIELENCSRRFLPAHVSLAIRAALIMPFIRFIMNAMGLVRRQDHHDPPGLSIDDHHMRFSELRRKNTRVRPDVSHFVCVFTAQQLRKLGFGGHGAEA